MWRLGCTISSLCGVKYLTHWGRLTHICIGNFTITGWDNGLAPTRRQVIITTNAGIFLIWSIGTNFHEILIEIHSILLKKMHLKMPSGWRPFCRGLVVLIQFSTIFNEACCLAATVGRLYGVRLISFVHLPIRILFTSGDAVTSQEILRKILFSVQLAQRVLH